jgi:hypothetical protein
MAKWIALGFVVLLIGSGWWASQQDAPSWAPALPTLVIAAAVLTGIVAALAHGLERRKAMASVAARLGLRFENSRSREEFRELGLGSLKLFVHCRPPDELSLLHRTVVVHFHNVMTGRELDGETELVSFDFSTSTRSEAPNQRGTFACFRTAGGRLPDLEIVPRLWGEKPEWLKGLTEAAPARRRLAIEEATFDAEYRAYSANEPAAKELLSGELLRFLTDSKETGWRVETSGEWMAVTRLAPAKKVGGLTDPMTPEELPREHRYGYFEHPIAPAHVPKFIATARSLQRIMSNK